MFKTNKQNISKYLLSTFLIVGLTTLSIQAWNGLTASPWDKLDYQKWNELVASVQSGIPSGAVMAFNLTTCPTGWSAYNNAVWRTIIWVGNWAGSNTSLGNTWGEKSAPAISATHNLAVNVTGDIKIATSVNNPSSNVMSPINWSVLATSPSGASSAASIYGPVGTTADITIWPTQHFNSSISWWITISWWGTAPDNMQPYVALLYCVKN